MKEEKDVTKTRKERKEKGTKDEGTKEQRRKKQTTKIHYITQTQKNAGSGRSPVGYSGA